MTFEAIGPILILQTLDNVLGLPDVKLAARVFQHVHAEHRIWLPTVDTLRNFFYAPTVEMQITFELLRQGSLAAERPLRAAQ
jgi:hypothetical protein